MKAGWMASVGFFTCLGFLSAAGGSLPAEGEESPSNGLPGYEGSGFCQPCHQPQHADWETSLHARTVHPPGDRDIELLAQSLLCGDYNAKHVLGVRHARRFMVDSEKEKGMHVLLPCRYDVGKGEWTHLHEDDWEDLTWERGCGACHTTGFSSDTLTYTEMQVGCESCHAPGVRHGDYRQRGGMISFTEISSRSEAQVCGSCHLQGGVSRESGLNFAYNYQAGDDLFADYEFDWAGLDESSPEETDNPIDIHQKLLIRSLVTDTAGPGGLRCTSCHDIHPPGHAKHESLPREEFCYLCHARGDFEVKEYNQACNVCEF